MIDTRMSVAVSNPRWRDRPVALERRLDLVEFIYWAKALQIDPTEFVARLADSLGVVLCHSKPRT